MSALLLQRTINARHSVNFFAKYFVLFCATLNNSLLKVAANPQVEISAEFLLGYNFLSQFVLTFLQADMKAVQSHQAQKFWQPPFLPQKYYNIPKFLSLQSIFQILQFQFVLSLYCLFLCLHHHLCLAVSRNMQNNNQRVVLEINHRYLGVVR